MQYRNKIIELINSNNTEAIMDWVEQQPLLEQPDIIREFKEIIEIEFGDSVNLDTQNLLEELTEKIDNYEDKILDEQLASLKLDIAKNDLDKSMDEIIEATVQMRTYVLECIVNNEPNAPQMKELAQQIIKFEKEAGTYDAKNWEAIL